MKETLQNVQLLLTCTISCRHRALGLQVDFSAVQLYMHGMHCQPSCVNSALVVSSYINGILKVQMSWPNLRDPQNYRDSMLCFACSA